MRLVRSAVTAGCVLASCRSRARDQAQPEFLRRCSTSQDAVKMTKNASVPDCRHVHGNATGQRGNPELIPMERILAEFSLRRLLPSLAAGLIAGALAVVVTISLAALIFSGNLAPHVARGIGLGLYGGVAIGLVVTLTTSVPGSIAAPQETTAAVLAPVAAGIAGGMGEAAAREAGFWTVAAAIAVTSFLTGSFFLALGRFKLS